MTAEELSLVVVELSFRLRQNKIMPNKPATTIVPHTMAAISKGNGIDMLFSPNESGNIPKKIESYQTLDKKDTTKIK